MSNPADVVAKLKLSVETQFVPFSQSRHKAEDHKTLNWVITLKRDGREVLKTDYSAGIAHCPGYAAKKAPTYFVPHDYKRKNPDTAPHAAPWLYRRATESEALAQYRNAVSAAECESGFPMEIDPFGHSSNNVFRRIPKGAAIQPDPLNVIYSLVTDSSVLDHGGFESWAAEYGYDADSRSAESIYRACLEIALKLRAAIGDSGLGMLRDIF